MPNVLARRGAPTTRPCTERAEHRAGADPAAAGAAAGGLPAHRASSAADWGRDPGSSRSPAILVATGDRHVPRLPGAHGCRTASAAWVHALHVDPGRRPPGRSRLLHRQPDRGACSSSSLDRHAGPHLQHRLHVPRPRPLALLRLPQPLHVLDAAARPGGRATSSSSPPGSSWACRATC